MGIEIDNDKELRSISARERMCIKLIIFLIGMIYPAKYDHQLDKFMASIKEELVK